jgi:eukaryotic-like serine/threonine-protein kinase
MSDVVVCNDTHLDRTVVVKSLKPGADTRRILDELAALQQIRSKHVVQIYDVIRDGGGEVIAIVEEFLPGEDLTKVDVPTSLGDFLKLAHSIAEGISDIHAHKRVHRDIKRQNMKFDAEHCLKIFDFGLARDASAEASTMGRIGTPGYMAPELFESTIGGRVKFSPAVDTYAFGATLLAISLGRLPRDMRECPPKLPCAEADFTGLGIQIPLALAECLNLCLSPVASRRPKMADVARLIAMYLLEGKHRALLVSGTAKYVLDTNNPSVRLSVNGQGGLTVTYNGLEFVVSDVEGAVAINNAPANEDGRLPGSCVIVLGGSDLGPRRTMITVDVSHPEVTL